MFFREFSVTWDCRMTFRKEKPNLCPKFLVLAGSSPFILRKLSSQASPCASGSIPGMVGDPWTLRRGAHPAFWNNLWVPCGPADSMHLQQNSFEVFDGEGATNSTLFAFTCRPRSWEKRKKTKAKPM